MDELQRENRSYWDRRAPSYTDVIKKNLGDGWDAVWADMLISRFPARRGTAPLRVLDVGTGPGFYAIILAARGYAVTAVDFSEKMLAEARRNAGALAERIDWWIEHPEERNRMAQRYADAARGYDVNDSIDALVAMFQDAIEAAKR